MKNMDNIITLKNIDQLGGMNFFIPNYQRGYRWTSRQVTDLLNDINEFKPTESGFYCLQPLVVQQMETDIMRRIREDAKTVEDVMRLLKGSWIVIDGQQRLTTLFIILKCISGESHYQLQYETRGESSEYLDKLGPESEAKSGRNIDFHHIWEARHTVMDWLEKRSKENDFSKKEFKDKILNSVKFIWYESHNEQPIKVFTRLNIGKISLTNAELIKALFLNRSNFKESELHYRQMQTAIEWDTIEYTLQSDEFWLFLNEPGYDHPTRIDLIFDIIRQKDLLLLKADKTKEEAKAIDDAIGNDNYSTFRYFFEYFSRNPEGMTKAWKTVKRIFNTFNEWFNDIHLYHYTGYLIATGMDKTKLLDLWNEPERDKTGFLAKLRERITDTIAPCRDLAKQYEIDGGPAKTVCRPLLLLHNVQTAINQTILNRRDYGESVFYKFPFHLYKNERWDVEHIDSNTLNPLENEADRHEWLRYSLLDQTVASDTELKTDIVNYITNKAKKDFDTLRSRIEEINPNANPLSDKEKNQIMNFVLLDAGTNRGYGNSIFPVKRRCIIGKDCGKKYEIDKDSFTEKVTDSTSSFIPLCTKYAFVKYYNTASASIKYWDRNDAIAYRNNILSTLRDFNVILTNESNEK